MKTKIFGILVIFLLLVTIPSASVVAEQYTITTDTVTKDALTTQTIQKVTVKTDKYTYTPGQPVKITVKNGPYSQSISFNDIKIKNMITNNVVSIFDCVPEPGGACPAIAIVMETITLGAGQIYTTTWYPSSKGTYRAYVDWWTEGTVTCQAIGCPEPEPGISGRTYSNYFWVR